MIYLRDILGMLAFRSRSLHALAARRALIPALVSFALGFLAFVLMRNSLYVPSEGAPYVRAPVGVLESLLDIHLLQMLLFLSVVYVPILIALSNTFAGDGLGFSVSRTEYSSYLSTLFPLWGLLFLIGAPMLPLFLILGYLDLSAGELWLMLSVAVFTIWAVKELNYISVAVSMSVFGLSLLTLPVLFVLTNFLLSLPFFILIPLLYIFLMRFRELVAAKGSESEFLQHLSSLTLNPRDADAHYQLGLLHFRRGNLDAARGYFEQALAIEAGDPEYHYFIGRVLEAKGEWARAVEEYGATYRLNPEFGLGDISREVGKAYLHTNQLEKAIEFLQYFLARRSSDPEGRYWLAVALRRTGKADEMRIQLNTILEQARSNPRFFRKGNRQWLYRTRSLLRGQASDKILVASD
jgi:tetratricopeptide (TPR) repeat protein